MRFFEIYRRARPLTMKCVSFSVFFSFGWREMEHTVTTLFGSRVGREVKTCGIGLIKLGRPKISQ